VTLRALAAAVAMITASTFTAWALYITLVEHPARLDSGAAAGRAQFRPSYRRAAPWQASLAVLALVTGLLAAALTARWAWLIGALALGAVVPLTLVLIRPINRRLLGADALADDEVLGLLRAWGRLHAARTALGGVGVLAFLLALRAR
jgi:Domain of unknown function (DUF1772)